MKSPRSNATVIVGTCTLAGLVAVCLLVLAGDLQSYGGQAGVGGTTSTPGAVTMFAKFEGLDGEAQDKDHKTWSNILSFREGKRMALADDSVGAGQHAVVDEFILTKAVDRTSPKLAEVLCKGQDCPSVQIHVGRTMKDGTSNTFYIYELKNVRIADCHTTGSNGVETNSWSGTGDQSPVPSESISLQFKEMRLIYIEHDENGRPKGNVEMMWKVEESDKN